MKFTEPETKTEMISSSISNVQIFSGARGSFMQTPVMIARIQGATLLDIGDPLTREFVTLRTDLTEEDMILQYKTHESNALVHSEIFKTFQDADGTINHNPGVDTAVLFAERGVEDRVVKVKSN